MCIYMVTVPETRRFVIPKSISNELYARRRIRNEDDIEIIWLCIEEAEYTQTDIINAMSG
jgi:hypothetical protein